MDFRKPKIYQIVLLVLFGLLVGWVLAYHLILKIKTRMLPPGVELIALTPLEFVLVQLKISLIFVIVFLIPFLICWASKIKLKIGFVWFLFSVFSFLGGMCFAYFLLPYIIKFLTLTVTRAGIEPMYSLEGFIFFVISMMLVLGLVFEFPVIAAWMSKVGLISSKTLSTKRRYAYVSIFIIAAIITPDPSPVSQILVAVPFLFFYEVSIITSKIFGD